MSHLLLEECFGKCLNLDIGKCLTLKILELAKIAIPRLRSGGKCLISIGQMSHAKPPPPTPTIIRGTPLIFRIRAKYLPSALCSRTRYKLEKIHTLVQFHPELFKFNSVQDVTLGTDIK